MASGGGSHTGGGGDLAAAGTTGIGGGAHQGPIFGLGWPDGGLGGETRRWPAACFTGGGGGGAAGVGEDGGGAGRCRTAWRWLGEASENARPKQKGGERRQW